MIKETLTGCAFEISRYLEAVVKPKYITLIYLKVITPFFFT
jgi:hypothetical protein